MPSYTKDLLVKPDSFTVSSGETVSVSPTSSGFEYLMFRVRKLLSGEKLSGETDECELGIVVLGGRCSVESTAGSWFNFGGRAHVFAGMPTALYLPTLLLSFAVVELLQIVPQGTAIKGS